MASAALRWHPLHTACIQGDLHKAKQVVAELGPDATTITERNSSGWTALHFAVTGGNQQIVGWLLSLGADPNAQTDVGDTPLHQAVGRGQPSIIRLLLEQGADPHLRNATGLTPVHLCAQQGEWSMAKLLLDNHPTVLDTKDVRNRTPLAVAFASKQKQFVTALLKAFPQAVEQAQELAHSKLGDREFLDIVRKAAARCRNGVGSMRASQRIDKQKERSLEELTAAARTGDVVQLERAVAGGADVNLVGKNGWTALMEAASSGQLEAVRWLLDHGAQLDLHNKKGMTAVQLAVREGFVQITRLLVDGGASVEVRTKQGLNLRELAESSGHEHLASWLAAVEVSHYQAKQNKQEVQQLVITRSISSTRSNSTTSSANRVGNLTKSRSSELSFDIPVQTGHDEFVTWLNSWQLSHYLQVLEDNGFDSLALLTAITPEDLDRMGFKLGHKRMFLRAQQSLEQFLVQYLPPTDVSPSNTPPMVMPPSQTRGISDAGTASTEFTVQSSSGGRRHRGRKAHVAHDKHDKHDKPPKHPKQPKSRSPGPHRMPTPVYTSPDLLAPTNAPISEADAQLSAPLAITLEDPPPENPALAKTGSDKKSYTYKELKNHELKLQGVIGEGSFGRVRKGMWRGMAVAVKELKLDGFDVAVQSNALHELQHEARMLARVCNHNCVIQFIGVVLRPRPCVVTRYMPNGSAEDALVTASPPSEFFTIPIVLQMAIEAATGVLHLHSEGVIHRDLAARNLLIDEHFHVRVADFGFSRVKAHCASKGYTKTDMGPIRWTAPEAMRRKCYSEASDVFSFGVVLYEMFARTTPWDGHETLDVAFRVCSGERMTVPSTVLPALTAIIEHAWQQDALCRPTMSQMISDLQNVLDDYLLVTQPAASAATAARLAEHNTLRRPAVPGHEYMSITLDECAQEFEDLVNFR